MEDEDGGSNWSGHVIEQKLWVFAATNCASNERCGLGTEHTNRLIKHMREKPCSRTEQWRRIQSYLQLMAINFLIENLLHQNFCKKGKTCPKSSNR